TVQILRAEHVDEQLYAALIKDKITLARLFFDVQAVLKTRAATRHYAHAQTSRFRKTRFAGHKLFDLAYRGFGDIECHRWSIRSYAGCSSRGGLCRHILRDSLSIITLEK